MNGERPAFLLQGPAMLGMMLLGFVVYVGVMTAFTSVIQGSIAEALTEVPTLYQYDQDGRRVSAITQEVLDAAQPLLDRRTELQLERDAHMRHGDYDSLTAADEEIDAVNGELNGLGYYDLETAAISMYMTFARPATVVLICVVVFAGAGHFWERGFGLWRRGTSLDMLRASVFGLAAIWLVPEIWDAYAIHMTQFSQEMINPGGDPQQVVDSLWCKMGASAGCMFDFASVLNPASWATALTSPNDFGQSLLGEILLPAFKMTPALIISITVFVTAKVRVLFISIVLITFPLWMVLRNVPYLKQHAKSMVDNMIGASMAPFLSAMTLYVGWTWVENTPIPSLEEWVSVLGIVTLAGLWPVILAPFLTQIIGSVQGSVQTAVMNSNMMAMQMGMGAAGGAIAGAAGGQGGLGSMIGTGLAGAAAGTTHGAIASMPATGQLVREAAAVGGPGGIVKAVRVGKSTDSKPAADSRHDVPYE